jgi:hypothetical protein
MPEGVLPREEWWFLTFSDRDRAVHAASFVHRAVEIVGAGLKVHFELGTLIGWYVWGFVFNRFTFDLQGVHDAPVFTTLNTHVQGSYTVILGWFNPSSVSHTSIVSIGSSTALVTSFALPRRGCNRTELLKRASKHRSRRYV